MSPVGSDDVTDCMITTPADGGKGSGLTYPDEEGSSIADEDDGILSSCPRFEFKTGAKGSILAKIKMGSVFL